MSRHRRTLTLIDAAASPIAGVDLLGGKRRSATRARGFASWHPQPETLAVLDQVWAVLHESRAYLPLTIRQIFYSLVGAHGFPKNEAAYDRLGEYLNRVRRAKLVAMGTIRDDGGARFDVPAWQSAADFLAGVREAAVVLRLDRTQGQPTRVMILSEAAGVVPQLGRVASDYGVPVLSSGGFESVTEKFRLAEEVAADGWQAEILHVGDHDPSGTHLFLALAEDVTAFAAELGGAVTFSRFAVIPTQIRELSLFTAPPKHTDNRAFAGETCQVEAIPPDVLAGILREAIEARLDRVVYAARLRREERERRRLHNALAAGGAAR